MGTPLRAADDEALRAALGSDPDAVTKELYRRHGTTLYRLAVVVCQREDEAERAVTAAFRALREQPPEARGEDLYEALVGHTCDHCFHGSHFTRRAPLASAADATPPLAILSRRQRSLLGLIQLCGFTLREAALCMGVEEKTAARRIRSALHSLRATGSQGREPVFAEGAKVGLDREQPRA